MAIQFTQYVGGARATASFGTIRSGHVDPLCSQFGVGDVLYPPVSTSERVNKQKSSGLLGLSILLGGVWPALPDCTVVIKLMGRLKLD